MRRFQGIKDSEEDKARARLIAHFEDHPQSVFYSRQLEVLFEREFFHWVTNRAIRRLVEERRIISEPRRLEIGSEMKLLWHNRFRFYKRAASEVFDLVNRYASAATDGTLGLQGEHLILAAFARRKFVLQGEELNSYNGIAWDHSGHDLDFIFERDGKSYGVEVKNTLGYLDASEFVTKIRIARHLGIRPVFAVRALPATWIQALAKAGGFAMVMGFQFYPWTHTDLAGEIRDKLHLPVDTPRKIESGTMQRFENWIGSEEKYKEADSAKVDKLLDKIEKPPGRYVPPGEEA